MSKVSRRTFLAVAGLSAGVSAVSAVTIRRRRADLPTFQLKDVALPKALKVEIHQHNARRRGRVFSSLEREVMEDLATFQSIWHGRSLVAYAQLLGDP